MNPLAAVAVVLGAVVLYTVFVVRTGKVRRDEHSATAAFDAAVASGSGGRSSLLEGGLGRLARPIVRTQALATWSQSPMVRNLAARVSASGLYSRSIEVFLAYQLAAAAVGGTLVALAFVGTGLDALSRALLVIGAVGVTLWPYDRVSREVKKRSTAAAESLPDFVELLLIPITSGMSVEASLAFTAKQTGGIVSDNVRWLLETLASRTMKEGDAYVEAGRRIGTPEAVAFFSSLYQSQVQGVEVAKSLRRQAESLRVKAHEGRRAAIKKIPVKLIVVFAVHFLPLLFILVMLPLMISLSQL